MLPTMCIKCRGVLDGSLEHVFPRALGGTKTSRSLYCSACNIRLGREIDAKLTADFEWFTMALDVQRDRNKAPTLRMTTTDGKRINLAAGGVPSTRDPSLSIVKEGERKRTIRIQAPVMRPELGEQLLSKALKDLGVDRSAITDTRIFLTSTPVGSIDVKFSMGGPEQFRAVAKIALGFLALELGDLTFNKEYISLREAATSADGSVDDIAWTGHPIRELETPIPTDGAQHRVMLYSTASNTWAHVEIYGTFAFTILLCTHPLQEFQTPLMWIQNPTTGDWKEYRSSTTSLPIPFPEHRGISREHLAELMRVIARRQRDLAIELAVREEVELGSAMAGTNGDLPEEMIWQIARRISHRVMSLLFTEQQPLNLEMQVPDHETLGKITEALRRVGREGKGNGST